ncbi:MAG: hypothetical protein PVF97_08330, partial [Desulfobacterales bacterium]
RAKVIAQMAAQAGVNCQVGTHVGESELLGAAGRQLAHGIPNFDCYGGGSQVLFARMPERTAKTRVPDRSTSAGVPDGIQTAEPSARPSLGHSALRLDIRS